MRIRGKSGSSSNISESSSSTIQEDNTARTPTLDKFARDLTKMAREKALDRVIGRENEVMRVVQILSRRKKNNPILLGEPGVGKTAIVEGLAEKIVSTDVPDILLISMPSLTSCLAIACFLNVKVLHFNGSWQLLSA